MMINQYIKELLSSHDCVIVPDFGGFIANYNSAQIKDVDHLFLPPKKQIAFNSNLRYNDGLLINHISEAEQVDYLEAKKRAKEYVSEIFKTIESENRFTIDGVGLFYYNKEKSLQFEPDIMSNLLTDSFGLTSFHFPEIHREESLRRATSAFKSRDAIRKVLHSKTSKRILIGTPLVLALALIPFNTGINYSSLNPLKGLLNEKTDYSKELIIESPKSTENTIDQATEEHNALFYSETEQKEVIEQEIIVREETVFEEVLPEVRHYLIAGSFKEESNAGILAEQLKNEGLSAFIMNDENGMFRVAVNSFNTKEEARTEAANISKKTPVWVLTK